MDAGKPSVLRRWKAWDAGGQGSSSPPHCRSAQKALWYTDSGSPDSRLVNLRSYWGRVSDEI